MTTLGSLKASFVFHFTSTVGLCTVVLCYTLAVSFKHVKPWLPMFSDCAVMSPEMFPFRFGVLTTAMLMGCESVVIFLAAAPRSRSALWLGVLASLCLGVVAVVNMKEAPKVHSVAAVAFFVLYWGNMVVLSIASLEKVLTCCKYSNPESLSLKKKVIIVLRQFLTCFLGVILIIAAILNITVRPWSKVTVYIAVCEWIGILGILLFSWTFADDTSDITINEVRCSMTGASTNNGYHSLDLESP